MAEEFEGRATKNIPLDVLKESERKKVEAILSSPEHDQKLQEAFELMGGNLSSWVTAEEDALIKEIVAKVGSEEMVTKCDNPDFNLIEELERQQLWQFFKLKAEQVDALGQLAATLLENMEGKRAEAVYSLLVLLNSTDASYWHGMGLSRVLEDRIEKAIPLYEISCDLNPRDAGPLLSLVYAYLTIEQRGQAEEVLKRALSVVGKYEQPDPTVADELKQLKKTLES